METLADLVQEWDLAGHLPLTSALESFTDIHKRIVFFYETHYFQYIPTLSTRYPDFETRISRWLSNTAPEADQRLLLELLPHITFFSREDFAKLHQVAFEGPIVRWIIDELHLRFDDPSFNTTIANEAHLHTWYCPLSDSMQITDFHHANSIGGVNHRPDWRSLAQFGDQTKVADYMANHQDAMRNAVPLKRIVILEDFIGSGTQLRDAVAFIRTISSTVPVLLVPLIVCPKGADFGRDLERKTSGLTFRPIIELRTTDVVTEANTSPATTFVGALIDLVKRSFVAVEGNRAAHPLPYDPFGFPPGDGTGALAVLYSNTPANTLPVIQHESDTWEPLFPRVARVR